MDYLALFQDLGTYPVTTSCVPVRWYLNAKLSICAPTWLRVNIAQVTAVRCHSQNGLDSGHFTSFNLLVIIA